MRSIVGREDELRALVRVVDERARRCVVVQLDGEAGIGKTSVLRSAMTHAREHGWQLLACTPAESEQSLAFAVLGDLLEPVFDEFSIGIPDAQRTALETALARVPPSEAFGRLAVSRATLALLRELSGRAPLLIAIDDVQWLDTASAAVLGFALRRLRDAPVCVLLARRRDTNAGGPMLEGEPRIERVPVGPLSLDELGRLVGERLQVWLTRPRLAELHMMTGGNPYFALETVRALQRDDGQLHIDAPLPVPGDIAALLRARIGGHSAAALDALLLTAVSPQPVAAEIASVAGSNAGLQEALEAGLLERQGDRLRFTHPLLASVI